MTAKLPLRVGIPILLAAATMFASNHTAARVAFDHGASVAAAVLVRATGTALVLLILMRLQRVPIALPKEARVPAILAGVAAAAQSYCLYSAVSRIPVALALLVFQTAPMMFVLLSWLAGKERPRASAFAAMLLALAGLALALNFRSGFTARWAEIGTGVIWALAGAVAFALMLYVNAHALKAIDGRLRTFAMTAVTAAIVLVAGSAAKVLVPPLDVHGWLGIALLTVFYCGAMCTLFITLPRLHAASTVALNFEPIALIGLGWIFLGQAVTSIQIVGAFLTVGAITWLGMTRA